MNPREEIAKFGRKLVENGLTTSFFGNISAVDGEKMLISRTGSMLDELEGDQVVEVHLKNLAETDCAASSELCVHRKIAVATGARRIMHAHTVYSILVGDIFSGAASFDVAEVLPFLGYVPIAAGKSGSEELAENTARALLKNKVVIVKGHGVFAVGDTLKECYIYVSALEFHSKELILKSILEKNGII
jgi:L-fuculose-phosphate aldolase